MGKKIEPKIGMRDIWSARLRAVDRTTGFPYLSDALFALVPVITNQIETFGVDRHGRLYVNPEYFAACTPDQGAAVLAHEIWHLLLKHPERADRLNVCPEERDLCNIAEDCEINQKDNLSQRLPSDCCLPAKFGLPERGLFEEYFELLKKSHPQLIEPPVVRVLVRVHADPQGDVCATGDDDSSQQSSSSEKQASSGDRSVGSGRCGSCAHGQPEDYELPPPGAPDKDGKPCQTPGVSPAKWEVLISITAQKILEHSQACGNVPGGWLRWAEEVLQPKVDWRKALPPMIQGALGRSLGYTWTDYRKISRRRSPSPRILRPAHVNSLPVVDVVLDTSGSMSEQMIAQGIAEVGGILDMLGYATKVNVYPTDATASPCQKVFRPEQIRAIGGGGTDMREGLRAIEERVRREPYDRPSLVVIITDAFTPWPHEAPPWPVLIIHLGGCGSVPDWACPPDHDVLVIPNDDATG